MYGTIKFWNLVSETKYTKASVGPFFRISTIFYKVYFARQKGAREPTIYTILYYNVLYCRDHDEYSTLYTYKVHKILYPNIPNPVRH